MTLPPNFHALYDAEPSALAAPAGETEAALVLAGPAGGRLAAGAAAAVADRADDWGLTPEDLATVAVGTVSGGGGALRTVRLTQHVGGVEVFNSDVTVALDADDAAVALSGRLFGGAAAAAASTAPADARTVAAEAAIAFAASDLTGAQYGAGEFAAAEGPADAGPYRFYRHDGSAANGRPAFARDVRVKDVLFPLGGERFEPGIYVELWLRGLPASTTSWRRTATRGCCSAATCAATWRSSTASYATGDPLKRPLDSPAPGTPHPTGDPDGFQAPVAAARRAEIDSLLGDPWLPPDATTTARQQLHRLCGPALPRRAGRGRRDRPRHRAAHVRREVRPARPATDPTNLRLASPACSSRQLGPRPLVRRRLRRGGRQRPAGQLRARRRRRRPVLAEGKDFTGTENANMAHAAGRVEPDHADVRVPGPEPDRRATWRR